MGPGDLCGEQRLGLGSAVRSMRGRVQDGPQVPIPGDTPPAVPVTPESHPACAGSCLILLPAISQSLSLLPAFLAAEVAAGLVGQAGLEGAPEAVGNLEWEWFCSPRDGQSLALLRLLAVSCHHFFHAPTAGSVGPQGLWPRISWCRVRARRSRTHPSCCLQLQLTAKLGVNWMLIPLLSPALSPAPSCGSAGTFGRAEPRLQIALLRGCR